MSLARLPVICSLLLLTLLGLFVSPGYGHFSGDAPLYVAILEHLRDPAVLARDLAAQSPQAAYTLYDETALVLRRVTGLDFTWVLAAQALLFRFCSIAGAYLIASSCGLGARMSLLAAAAHAAGGLVTGPDVAIFEIGPIPRSFALGLLFLGVGLVAHGRHVPAAAAGAAALLFHPPTALAYWIAYLLLTLFTARGEGRRREHLIGIALLLAAAAVLLVAASAQSVAGARQPLAARLDPLQESVLRARMGYMFVSQWGWRPLAHHFAILAALASLVYLLRRSLKRELLIVVSATACVGALSVPASYLLLDRMKLAAVTQLQPTRALLFATAFTVILAVVRAVTTARAGGYAEGFRWFALAFAVPVQMIIWANPGVRYALFIPALAAGATLVASGRLHPRAAPVAWAALLICSFFLLRRSEGVATRLAPRPPELAEVASWARAETSLDAVFLFHDSSPDLRLRSIRQMHPSIFRAAALCAVYVDWKSGGQLNFQSESTREWLERWRRVSGSELNGATLTQLSSLGIDYLVVETSRPVPGARPVFSNGAYAVYRLRERPGGLP